MLETPRISIPHSFSNLGTIAKTRDEAEIQTFLSPSGY